MEPHAHDEYQLCLTEGVACQYRYRGASHAVPRGSLCVIHPGELHSTRDAEPRPPGTVYHMLYLDPAVLRRAAEDAGGRPGGEPFFPAPVVSEAGVLGAFFALRGAWGGSLGA